MKKVIYSLSGTVGTVEKYTQQDVEKIITETCNKYEITGFTLIPTIGMYEGIVEKSYRLEILMFNEFDTYKFGSEIKIALEQDAVYMEFTNVNSIAI